MKQKFYQRSNHTYVPHSSVISGNTIIVNGQKIPDIPKRKGGSCVSVVDNHVYVNGYEYKDGAWKRTIAAIWHYWF